MYANFCAVALLDLSNCMYFVEEKKKLFKFLNTFCFLYYSKTFNRSGFIGFSFDML